MLPWCTGIFGPAGPYVMPFVRHGGEVAYSRRLYALFWRYREEPTGKGELDCSPVCCSELPYVKFFLVRDTVGWWRELEFERRQRIKREGAAFRRVAQSQDVR